MKLVIYSVVLNQHQAPVADALWDLTGHQFRFVELTQGGSNKGGTTDYSSRPYLLKDWESDQTHDEAMRLACTAECCIFSGVQSLPFMKERLKLGLLSFDMGERWLKKGLANLFSPAISRMYLAYWKGGWRNKPLYKLCMSGFAAEDHARIGMYKNKCYKWGYFTKSPHVEQCELATEKNGINIMWCARFVDMKHPELPILMMNELRKSYEHLFLKEKIHLDMYGEGYMKQEMEELAHNLGLQEYITFRGNVNNEIIHEEMRKHDIFLFTSDRNEGWGAVANEAMSEGCLLIASDEIGSSPFLIKDGENGLLFKNKNLASLNERVLWAINNPVETEKMKMEGSNTMRKVWSPENASLSLLQLIQDLSTGRDTSTKEGPCSKITQC